MPICLGKYARSVLERLELGRKVSKLQQPPPMAPGTRGFVNPHPGDRCEQSARIRGGAFMFQGSDMRRSGMTAGVGVVDLETVL